MENININILVGKIVTHISKSDDEIIFKISDTESYRMFHTQDCCEYVTIEDICGELDWLIGERILVAEERTSRENPKENQLDVSFSWTFYELATIKGSVTIRWYGESNGYYSESVDFYRIV